jgi:predicted RNA-binding Zn ribbon-like protein
MKFEFIAGHPALEFANTVHHVGGDPPDEELRSPSDLITWAGQAGLLRKMEAQRLLKAAARDPNFGRGHYDKALQLRATIYAVFSDVVASGLVRPKVIDAFQRYFRAAMKNAAIQRNERGYLLACAPHVPPLDRVFWSITHLAAQLLLSDESIKIRQCAGGTCTWLFLDESRNGMRRWCDIRLCGNRDRVRRFRERHSKRRHDANGARTSGIRTFEKS